MVRRVKLGDLSFEIEINRKLTVIIGDSGSGKTTFTYMLENKTQLEPEELKQTFGTPLLLVRPVPEIQALSVLNDWSKYDIAVIDCDVFNINSIAKAINAAQIPFILISREKISVLSIHYDSVFRFHCNNKLWRTVREYTPKLGLRRGLWTVVEDSKLGYKFYKFLLSRGSGDLKGINVISAGGFRRIPEFVNPLVKAWGDVQLIADAATFGGCYGDIKEKDRVTCFLPECFEEVLAESELFSRFRSTDKVNPLSIEALQYKSLEQYYEKDNNIAKTVNFTTGQLTPAVTNNFVLFEQNGTVERKTRVETDMILSKALHVSPAELTGRTPEKQIWSESGKLYAVKAKGRWHVLVRE